MGHDQRFKEFLQLFLRDFLKLFYPEVEERLDFETLELIDKELFTDFPEGNPREADVVAKLRNREGSPEVIVYRSGLTKGTGVLSGARRIDVTMSITRIPL